MVSNIIHMYEASITSGKYDGHQANIDRIQPLCAYVCCGAHVTHLVSSRAAQTTTVFVNALNVVKALSTFYND